MEQISLGQFLAWLNTNWEQGEHIVLVGQTGSGKTRLESQILECRDYVVVLALKRYDDTLKVFHEDLLPTIKERYRIYKKWPPLYSHNRVILWLRPERIEDIPKQQKDLKQALEKIYLSGGWTVCLDDAGYAASFLKAALDIGILLNQGRSSKLSIVVVLQQPKSVIARIPSEALRQTRHKILFNCSDNDDELDACAKITGVTKAKMLLLMRNLKKYEFLYLGKEHIFHVVQ